MSHVNAFRAVVGFWEQAVLVCLGLALMVLSLGLGVTMINLPVGVILGLLGCAIVGGGLFVRFDHA
jgi:hypothetical protein